MLRFPRVTKVSVVLILLCTATQANGQKSIPESVQGDLSSDLSKIQKMIEDYNREDSVKVPVASSNYNTFQTGSIAVVIDQSAPIKESADSEANTMANYPKGSMFVKAGEQGDFYKIQFGDKAGWVSKSATVQPIIADNKKIEDILKQWTIMQPISSVSESSKGKMFDSIVNGLVEMRDKWKSNPYLEAEGFQISLGVPMSVNFTFKFK